LTGATLDRAIEINVQAKLAVNVEWISLHFVKTETEKRELTN
jgi:hypothetical protein